MHRKLLIISVMFVSLALVIHGQTPDSNNSLGLPVFHHLHLNSTNPNAAIDFYTRQFPSTSKITFAGGPALQSPNDVLILFTKVKTPPPLQPQTAIWHFGWYVADVRKNLELYKKRPDVKLLPLYTSDEGGFVYVNSDTWPGAGGVPGLTKAEIAEAKAKGVQPVGGSGFAYMQGPDGAVVEYPGNMPERFNRPHVLGRSVLQPDLVSKASRCPAGSTQNAVHRGQLQTAAWSRQDLASTRKGRDVSNACGHRRVW